MPAIIVAITPFPTEYYCGPHKGWLTDILQAQTYGSLAQAQAVIDSHNMYALATSTPITSGIISQFVAHALHQQSFEVTPISNIGDHNGAQCDLQSAGGTGLYCCIMTVRPTGAPGDTLLVRMQHSDDGMSWSDIALAVFPPVTIAPLTSIIQFVSAKQFIRSVGNISGSDTGFTLSTIVCQSDT